MSGSVTLRVNGQSRTVRVAPDTPLLYVLRNDLELNGAKYGCGLGECGACTVLMDGRAIRSCVMPVGDARGRITTIEGLGTTDQPSAVQRAFIAEQACQCGFCGCGMVMASQALLQRNRRPTEAEVKAALESHLCRCGSHNRVVKAVMRAAQELRAEMRASEELRAQAGETSGGVA